jgi:tetratricopeptide (TPR) repeat protein
METKKIIILAVVMGVLGVSAYVALYRGELINQMSPVGETATSTGGETTVIPGTNVEVSYDTTENVVPTIPVPDLTNKPVFGPFAVSPGKENGALKIAELQGKLRQDSSNFENWIELGLTFSSVGDHKATIPAYTYASALRPKSSLPHANLAYVYGWHLKDLAKAEAEYKKALEINPGEWYINQQLFDFYRFVMEDKAKARAFGEAQAKAIPALALDLKVLIAELDR